MLGAIFRGYTFRVKRDAEQTQRFCEYAGVCRLVWNLALEQRRDHWRQYRRATGDALNFVAQARELTALRAEVPFVKAVSQDALSRTLKDLDTAYGRFFKGLGGYPRTRRKHIDDRFGFAGRGVRVEVLNAKWARSFLPKIGCVNFRLSRPIEGTITEAMVCRTVLGWQVSIGCKIEREIAVVNGTVGIDRGVAVPLMLSDGTSFVLPGRIAEIEKRHRRAQRVVSRRKRGSARWRRAVQRAAGLKARQARIRKYWAHQTTTRICRKYGIVVVENPKTRNMTRTARGSVADPGTNVAQKIGLNRSILKVAWHQLGMMLAYKASRLVKVSARHTSQTCSHCAQVDPRSRKNQAVFSCTACGFGMNADLNAAINIRQRGITAVLDVEGRQIDVPFEASTFKLAA